MIRHYFEPGKEPQVLTADLCEGMHETCPGIDRKLREEPVFCICWCHKKATTV